MSATGTWNLTVDVPWPIPPINPTLTLRQNGSVLTGSMKVDGYDPVGIYDGALDGTKVAWKVKVTSQQGTAILAFTGKITDRNMPGKVDTPWGPFDFTGSKQPAGIRRFFGLARSRDASQPSSPM